MDQGHPSTHPSTFEDLHAALACSTRLAILCVLANREATVTDLSRSLGFGMSLLSAHLRVLRQSGIVKYRLWDGCRHYTLTPAVCVNQSRGLLITLTADDGSVLTAAIPKAAPVMRVLRAARAIVEISTDVASQTPPPATQVEAKPMSHGCSTADPYSYWPPAQLNAKVPNSDQPALDADLACCCLT